MNKLRSVYDYELEIKYFSVSRRNGLFSSEKRRKLGTKQISINLGENETKWKIKKEMNEYGIEISFEKVSFNSNNFSVRLTCMVPIILEDKKEASMHTEHFSRPAKYFDAYKAEYLSMSFKDFIKDRSFQNGDLTIHIKIELQEGNYPKEFNKHVDDESLILRYEDLYFSGEFSDFTIICSDDEEFPVHRCILSVNSPVLKTMMLTNMQESIENKLKVNDIDGLVMHKILLCMYTQEIDDINDHLEGLLYGAEKYQIQRLKDLCIDDMFENLNTGNAVEYFMLASLYDAERLKQLCLMYIQIYYDDFRQTEEWQELSAEQSEFIEQYLKDYKARVNVDKIEMEKPYSFDFSFLLQNG